MIDEAGTPGEAGPGGAGAEVPRVERLFKFAAPHRVRYDEIDAQGVVGAAAWVNILQLARVEYLRNLGLLSMEGGSAPVQALVRTCAVEYLASARFDDALLVRVRASYLGHRSCRFEFLVDNIDTSIRHLAAGVTLVCVQAADRKAIAWPRVWIDRLAELEGTNLKVGQR